MSGGSGAEPLTGPEGALLENTANNFSPDPLFSASDYRKRRYEARAFLWHESTLDRVRGCGHHPVNPAGYVAVRLAGGMAGFAGLPSRTLRTVDPHPLAVHHFGPKCSTSLARSSLARPPGGSRQWGAAWHPAAPAS